MKYDDASWHSGGDYPANLPAENAGTHAGMYLAWALLSGLAGEFFIDDFPEDLKKLKDRSVTPGRFFLECCDGKLFAEELSDVGNRFTAEYYDMESGQFLADYEAAMDESLPSLYHVPDTWDTFEKLKPIFDARFREWRGDA